MGTFCKSKRDSITLIGLLFKFKISSFGKFQLRMRVNLFPDRSTIRNIGKNDSIESYVEKQGISAIPVREKLR